MLRLWSCVKIARRCGSSGAPYADAHAALSANGLKTHPMHIAHPVEQQTVDLWVGGSNPSMQSNGKWGNPSSVRIRLHFKVVAKLLRVLGFASARRDEYGFLSC